MEYASGHADDANSTLACAASARPAATKKRRWLRFSLRGLLLALTVVTVGLGAFVNRVYTQQQAVAKLEELGGTVIYEPTWLAPLTPNWITQEFGDDVAHRAVEVRLSHRVVDRRLTTPSADELSASIRAIARLSQVKRVSLHTLDLHDEDLELLWPLRNQVEQLSINELFHGHFRGTRLELLSDWQRLERLTVYSSGLNQTLNLEPLTALPNLRHLAIGTGSLDEKSFAVMARLEPLETLNLFACRFEGDHLRHLRELPNLVNVGLHNTHAMLVYDSYTMDGQGQLQPSSAPTFRFERSYDAWMGYPNEFPHEAYGQWQREVLPEVEISEWHSS